MLQPKVSAFERELLHRWQEHWRLPRDHYNQIGEPCRGATARRQRSIISRIAQGAGGGGSEILAGRPATHPRGPHAQIFFLSGRIRLIW